MLNAETSENITVAAALQQELETRHLPLIDLVPLDGMGCQTGQNSSKILRKEFI